MSLQRLAPLVVGRLRITSVLEPDCATYAGDKLPELQPVPGDKHAGTDKARDPWGTCACCGARIGWRVLVEDDGGNAWALGRTCAARADGLATHELGRFEAVAQDRGRLARFVAKHREALAATPHPTAARRDAGETAEDYLRWCLANLDNVRGLRRARRRFHYEVEAFERAREAQARADQAKATIAELAPGYFASRYAGEEERARELLDAILDASSEGELDGAELQAVMDAADPRKAATA